MKKIKILLRNRMQVKEASGKLFISKACLATGIVTGPGGFFLASNKCPLGSVVWHIGLVALLACLVFYLAGRFQKAVDDATDFLY